MTLVPSTFELQIGASAPDFQLLNTKNQIITRDHFKNHPLLVIFLSNHCPYVKHIAPQLSSVVKVYQNKGIKVVAINSNDIEKYPDDSPAKMKEEVEIQKYSFSYLFDESQDIAKAYKAACTPDFFLFDKNFKLYYMGQFDDSRPGNNIPVTGKDLVAAMNSLLRNETPPINSKPATGCNIKWQAGNNPPWFG
ncbi:MAG: thioredoxin family protein [Candidatus Cloacimonadota bacterium]|nr:MAG: thioredoxin family protein [Candidatus Cloacimonadota bacterium]